MRSKRDIFNSAIFYINGTGGSEISYRFENVRKCLNSYVKGTVQFKRYFMTAVFPSRRIATSGSLCIGALPGALYIGDFATFYIRGTRVSEISHGLGRFSPPT